MYAGGVKKEETKQRNGNKENHKVKYKKFASTDDKTV